MTKGCPLLDISSHLTSDHRKPQLDTRWCRCGCPPIIFASSNLPELWIKSTVNLRWPPRPTHLANNIPLNFIESPYFFEWNTMKYPTYCNANPAPPNVFTGPGNLTLGAQQESTRPGTTCAKGKRPQSGGTGSDFLGWDRGEMFIPGSTLDW